MSYTGKVQNGVVVLPPEVHLEEGQEVEIIPLPISPEEEFILRETAAIPAKPRDWPDDFAANHDYYLYGVSKQQPRRGRWIPASQEAPELTDKEPAELTDQLQRFAKETENLPPDLAANHDHYLHGLPKQ